LFSVEDALKILVAALKALETPGLSKTEVMRLRCLIQTCGLYQKYIAEYMHYMQIERNLVNLEEKYEKLAKFQQERNAKLGEEMTE
jgi:hypothetical protein